MTEEKTQLSKFKDRNPSWSEIFGAITSKARPYTVATVIGAAGLLAAGGLTSSQDVLDGPRFHVSEATVSYVPTQQPDRPDSQTVKKLDDFAQQADRPGSVTPKKLDIDLDLPFKDTKVFELSAGTIDIAEAIDNRATLELDAINVIRKAMETAPTFADPSVAVSAKADAIRDALELAIESGDLSVLQYDDHAFRIAKALPKTTLFNEMIETLTWKREMVRSSIAATEGMATALEASDFPTMMDRLAELTEIMENYEFVTATEKMAEAMVEGLGKQTEDTAPNEDAGSLAPTYRNVSASPLDRLRDHLDGAAPAATHSI